METNTEETWELKKADTGKIYPNLSLDVLKKWFLEERIDENDLLISNNMHNWKRAKEIESLQKYVNKDIIGPSVLTENDFSFMDNEVEEELDLDMTPMIDVTFLLLIFFLVTATFTVHEIKNIQVPKAGYTEKFKQEKLTVSIDRDRKIYFNQEAITRDSLKARISKAVSASSEQDLVLVADHTVDYGFIISVLDEINGAGLKNVKLKLEKKK
jgi:biopolymer transport protein ExbD